MKNNNVLTPRCWIVIVAIGMLLSTSVIYGEDATDRANALYYQGSYEEAKEAYAALADAQAASGTLGTARCHLAVGKIDAAVVLLERAAKQHEQDARFSGELAKIAMRRGDHKAAAEWATKALKLDERQTAARWVTAELHRLAGRMKEAGAAYEWFIDYYNGTDEFAAAEDLHYVGLAATQFARWNRVHDQFIFLVQDLYPDILERENGFWPARLESGLLFLEKFNDAEAEADFEAALKLNAHAAEVHAAMARLALQKYDLEKAGKSVDRALEINPKLLLAHQLKADIEMANFEPAVAEKILIEALALCPVSESTLGRLAAVQGCLDGLVVPPAKESRMAKLIEEATARNPHAGEFFESVADSLDTMRRYPQAAHYFKRAIEAMPELVGAYGKLGMVFMRLGEEQNARKQLKTASDVDFENVRVDNSLKVLDVLDTYESLETDHFIVRFDPKHDELQARYIADYLERLYPELCRQLGYEPKEKSLFEIFNKSGNTNGHGWFSARMVGLPHIHTIGACAGKIVGMVSPGDMDEEFNWARVVKHEFVHVINLQQTNFNIPHWFTEALAVYNEESPRPGKWNEMLARRIPAGEVYSLDTINLGFIRPANSEDWQMAYCQAELYAEYMLERFGDDALAKMLDGYAHNLNTVAALQLAFNVTKDDFEKGYHQHVAKVVKDLPPAKRVVKSASFSEMEQALEKDPENPELLGDVAIGYLRRKAYPKARSLASKALKLAPKHQAATYVMVSLQLVIGETTGIAEKLDDALDPDDPQPELLQLLAGLKYKAEEYDEAAALYELGRRHFPGDETWLNRLLRVHQKSFNQAKILPLMIEKALADPDDLASRRTLAENALTHKDYDEAARWALEAIYIDVLDVDMHRILAEASVERKQHDIAIQEFEVAIDLKPQQLQLRLALADACVDAGQKEKAATVLKKLLELDPDYPGADVLLESLTP